MDSAPTDPNAGLAPGTVIQGEYRIERLLGEGGYGAVYAATQLNPALHDQSKGAEGGRRVALKMLHPEVVARGAARERFRREAQLAQSLSHPNTVRLFDFGEAEGRPFIIYEYLEGRSLDAVLGRDGPFSPQRAARVIAQTLKALMEAHAKGIVHRDIKPGNIFLCNFDGEPDFVKVLDFGIASAGEAVRGPTLTGEGMTVGTPAYMAPEQALAAELDGRADLYSVGLVMAELVSGKQVFGGDSLMRIVMAQASNERPPLPESAIHSPLGPVIQRATAKNRDLRFPNGRAMLDMIESVVARLGQTGPPVPYAASPSAPAHNVAPPNAAAADPRLAPTGYAMPSASSAQFANVHQTGGAQPPPTTGAPGYPAPPTYVHAHAGHVPGYTAVAAPPTTLGGAAAPVQAPPLPPVAAKRSTALVFAIGFFACAAIAGAVFGIWYALTPAEPAPTKKTAKTSSPNVIVIQRSSDDDVQEVEEPDIQIPDIDFPNLPNGGIRNDPGATAFFKFYGKDAAGTLAKLEAEGVFCNFNGAMEVMGPVATYTCTDKTGPGFLMQFVCSGKPVHGMNMGSCTSGVCETDVAAGCSVNFLVDNAHTDRARALGKKLH